MVVGCMYPNQATRATATTTTAIIIMNHMDMYQACWEAISDSLR